MKSKGKVKINEQVFIYDIHRDGPWFWASVRGMQGCSSQGKTLKELADNMRDVLKVYLSMRE